MKKLKKIVLTKAKTLTDNELDMLVGGLDQEYNDDYKHNIIKCIDPTTNELLGVFYDFCENDQRDCDVYITESRPLIRTECVSWN